MHTRSMAARLPLEVTAYGSVMLTAFPEGEDALANEQWLAQRLPLDTGYLQAYRHQEGLSPRERINAQLAFYSGARGVLRVLAYLIEQGQYEELHATIRRQARQIERMCGRRPSTRRIVHEFRRPRH